MRPSENKDIRRELDYAVVCDVNMSKLLTSHVQATGVPKEYIFFPLLSAVSSALGASKVKVSEEWSETCALWTAVVARRGSRRSAILNRFYDVIMEPREKNGTSNPPQQPLIISDCELADHLSGSTAQGGSSSKHSKALLGMFEELESSGLHERRTLWAAKRMYDGCGGGGGGGGGTTRSGSDSPTSLSLFTFLPPDDVGLVLDEQHVDLSSRLLLACPKSAIYRAADLKSPMPSNTPSIGRLLDVLRATHAKPQVYELAAGAKTVFFQYYDMLQEGMLRYDTNERNYCILSKACGQLARLSCSMSALRQALKSVVYDEEVTPANWNVAVGSEDVEAAKVIMDYVIDIRFSLIKSLASLQLPGFHHPVVPSAHAFSFRDAQNSSTIAHSTTSDTEPPTKRQRGTPAESTHAQSAPGMGQGVVATSSGLGDFHQAAVAGVARRQPLGVVTPQGLLGCDSAGRPSYSPSSSQLSVNQLPTFTSAFGVCGGARTPPTVKQRPPLVEGDHTEAGVGTGSGTGSARVVGPTTTDRRAEPLPGFLSGGGLSQQPHQQPEGCFYSCRQGETDSMFLPGRRSSVYLDCSTLTAADLAGFSGAQQTFLRRYGYKVKKLLEFRLDHRISPSTCAQRHLMPPIPKPDMALYDTQTRYPVIAAKEYLTRIAELGFGLIQSTWHATNNRKSLVFQKTPFDQLSDAAQGLLVKLHVDSESYMAAFNPPAATAASSAPPTPDPPATHSLSDDFDFPVPFPYFPQGLTAHARELDPSMQTAGDNNLPVFPSNSSMATSTPLGMADIGDGSTRIVPKTEPCD